MTDYSGNRRHPIIGDVYLINLQGIGSVQSGRRPGVVFQNNTGNAHSPNLVLLPLTTSLKKLGMPTHVLVRSSDTGLARDSVVLCENPVCIPRESLGRYLTHLPDACMGRIAKAHLLATSAISFLDLESIVVILRQAKRLNREYVPGR